MATHPFLAGRRLVEAAVLLAALGVPLFFLVPADSAFEPAKAMLLRTLGLVALLGHVLAGAKKRGSSGSAMASRWRDVAGGWSGRLLGAMALAWAAAVAGTVFSISPWTSLFGSQARAEGLATDTALLALVVGAAWLAASPRGSERLGLMMASSVLPAALYGLVQRFGLDPLPWAGDVVLRIVGPAGASPLFAAHLVMALPFAVWQAGRAWRAIAPATGADAGDWRAQLRLALWLVAVLAGSAALLLAGSRGPLLGLACGAAVAVLAQAARQGDRTRAGGVVAIGLAGILALVALNLAPPGSLTPLTTLPVAGPMLDRLSTALDPERGTTRVRLRLWEGSAAAVEWTQRNDLPRFAVGHGPETMDRMWARFYPPILAYDEPRGLVPDRAHNLVADLVITEGALGLIANLLVFAVALGACLVLADPSSGAGLGRAGLGWLAGGAVAAGLIAVVDHSRRLAGPFFGLGALAAVSAWLVLQAWRRAGNPSGLRGPDRQEAFGDNDLLGAGLVALVAHWVDLQFSFAVIATRMMLALIVGMWAGLAFRREQSAGDAGRSEGRETSRLMPDSLDAGHEITLAAPGAPRAGPQPLAGGHARSDAFLAMSGAGAVLVTDFAQFGLVGGGPVVATMLVVVSVLTIGLLVRLSDPNDVGALQASGGRLPRHDGASGGGQPRHGSIGRQPLVRGLAALAFYAGIAVALRRAGWQGEAEAWPSVAAVVVWLLVWLIGLCVWHAVPSGGTVGEVGEVGAVGEAGASQLSPLPAGQPSLVGPGLRSYLVVGAGLFTVAVLAWTIGAAPVLADVAAKEGQRGWQQPVSGLRAKGQSARAESFLDRARDRYLWAARLAPWEPAYRLALAREEVERGDLLSDRLERALMAAGDRDAADEYDAGLLDGTSVTQANKRDAAFGAGVAAAETAAALAPGGAGPLPAITKARALRVWADRTREAGRRADRLAKAKKAYEVAIAAAPGWPELLDEAALTAILAGDPSLAVAFTERAARLDPFYLRVWRTAAAAYALQDNAESALSAYDRYFEDYRNAGDLAALRGKLAVLTSLGRSADALTVAQTIVQLAPDDAHAEADRAALLEAAGRRTEALAAARRAAELDPADPGIKALFERLAGKP